MKTLAVMTSGGDCAGMNAAVRAVVRRAEAHGLSVMGIERGFAGVVENTLRPLTSSDVSGILHQGGTVLRTFRRPEFANPEVRDTARATLAGIDALVVIGGDGSFRGLKCIDDEWGIPGIGVPATIDNDIVGTEISLGFDTALNIATDAVDKIRDTATSHGRIFVIEVMGRHSGMLAAATAVCCGAEEILVPERAVDLPGIAARIEHEYDRGKQHAIIVVAEGIARAADVADDIRSRLDRTVRIAVLGHIQRGGSPTAFDRMLASRLGYAAVDRLMDGERGRMVGIVDGKVASVALGLPGGEPPALREYLELQATLR